MDDNKPKRIIGKRVRLVIGEEVPKQDDDSTVVGEDTLVHVRPEELEEGTQVVGEQITLIVGDPEPIKLIKAAMKRAEDLNLSSKHEIVALGKYVLSAQDKPSFKTRMSAFIEKCKEFAPLAGLAKSLLEIYNLM